MFEDDSLFSQCLEQPLNQGWEKTDDGWQILFDPSPYARPDARPFLILESIPAAVTAVLNGKELGVMQPCLPYRFEITGLMKKAGNLLSLLIPPDAFSRPPQNAYIDYKKRNVILDAAFTAALLPDGSADCSLNIRADLWDEGLRLQVFLMDPLGSIVEDLNIPAAPEMQCAFSLPDPILWSPESPELYSLNLSLEKGGMLCDMYAHGRSGKVGFKRLERYADGLMLNDCPFREKGVHLPSDLSEIDLSALKKNGTNLLLCAHPPLSMLEAADEMGLLVSALPHPTDKNVLQIGNHVSLI